MRLLACVCVCVSSCVSILYCPGVLSGSRAAWSREITVSGRGLVVEWGRVGEDGSQLLEPCQRTVEKSITFPTQHQHLPKGCPQTTPSQMHRPHQSVITTARANLVLYGLMEGAWGKCCRWIKHHLHNVLMPTMMSESQYIFKSEIATVKLRPTAILATTSRVNLSVKRNN